MPSPAKHVVVAQVSRIVIIYEQLIRYWNDYTLIMIHLTATTSATSTSADTIVHYIATSCGRSGCSCPATICRSSRVYGRDWPANVAYRK